jgi:hypothetical protein
MPERTSISSALKTPPLRHLQVDTKLIFNKQLAVIAAFCGTYFYNRHTPLLMHYGIDLFLKGGESLAGG